MRLMPVSIERIIAENRITNSIFRKSWSWKNYFVQYVYVFVIIAIMIVFDYSMRILWVPLWVYGFVCIMYISVRVAFNITADKEAADKEDELIKYILDEARAENDVYCLDEIKERLLSQSHINSTHGTLDEIESWQQT